MWRYLDDFPTLEQEADVHKGINWKGRVKNIVSDKEKPGFVKGIPKVKNYLMQYKLQEIKYLSLRSEDQYDNAYRLPWHKPKAVCNEARLSRTTWRVGAIADVDGLAFSQSFFVFWPKGALSIHTLAALLNSPVTNSWCHSKGQGKHNLIQTFRALPIPPIASLAEGEEIDTLSRELHHRIQENQIIPRTEDNAALKQLLLQIDAVILKAYDLPPVLERELLDTFQGVSRPTSFEFNGYYPQGFTAYIPLHELISEEFQEARADRMLERLEPVYDTKISKMVAWLTGN